MKRDMVLIRQILLEVEKSPEAGMFQPLEFEGKSQEEVSYHIALLDEAGLLIGHDVSDSEGYEWHVERLTWSGHEFLDSARNQYVWDEVLADMNDKGFVSASLDVMKRLLDAAIRKRLKVD